VWIETEPLFLWTFLIYQA